MLCSRQNEYKQLTQPMTIFWAVPKLKGFADERINVMERIENIARKGENADYENFLLFHNLSKVLFFWVV